MLFNSLQFAFFLPIVFAIYWVIGRRNIRLQNLFLLAASYYFYGCWSWKFLLLIVISSAVDFVVGQVLYDTEKPLHRKLLLGVSLATNLGILGFFKYYNFFIESFVALFARNGIDLDPFTLKIILPVGISFYTFQTLSYTIDIYRRQLEPTRDPIGFFAFVSFFPQLVAGPIERAKSLLPQFEKERDFDENLARDGMRQILWGLFKKMVIADNLAPAVDAIFSNYGELSGSVLMLGILYFAIQIYCDFSGYSDIAIGTAKLFGFRLMTNFSFPYFSRDIGEFWRRWHISLSTWFRDYVYIPLGGSRASKGRQFFNIFVTFTVSGFWHGANWTFIAWGALHGLFYLPFIFLGRKKYNDIAAQGSWFPSLREAMSIGITFLLVLLAWTFFRAPTVSDAIQYIGGIFDPSLFSIPDKYRLPIVYVIAVLGFEWIQRTKVFALDIKEWPVVLRWGLYILLVYLILFLGTGTPQSFIYFQF